MRRRVFVGLIPVAAFGQVDKIIGGLMKPRSGAALPDAQIAAGLKEALGVGADNAVKLTGVTDGFFKNDAIKILMPQKLQNVEKALRMAGGTAQMDELVMRMNRAAEKAAPEAKKYFKEAIEGMSINEAKGILSGGDTAATDYFKKKTSVQLTEAFRPHVETAMNDVGVIQQFNTVMASAQKIPFIKADYFDINQYVVGKATDGLFYMVGQEEKKIRKDPAAQVTPLLKQVFGGK